MGAALNCPAFMKHTQVQLKHYESAFAPKAG